MQHRAARAHFLSGTMNREIWVLNQRVRRPQDEGCGLNKSELLPRGSVGSTIVGVGLMSHCSSCGPLQGPEPWSM